MITCWTRFAASGDPNGAEAGEWAPLTAENPVYRVFRLDDAGNVATVTGPRLQP